MLDTRSTTGSLVSFALSAQAAVQACNLDKQLAKSYFDKEAARPAIRRCFLGLRCREKKGVQE